MFNFLAWSVAYTQFPNCRREMRQIAMSKVRSAVLVVLLGICTIHVGAQDAYTQRRLDKLETNQEKLRQNQIEFQGQILVLRADHNAALKSIDGVSRNLERYIAAQNDRERENRGYRNAGLLTGFSILGGLLVALFMAHRKSSMNADKKIEALLAVTQMVANATGQAPTSDSSSAITPHHI